MGHGVDSEPSGWVTDYALMASLFVFAASLRKRGAAPWAVRTQAFMACGYLFGALGHHAFPYSRRRRNHPVAATRLRGRPPPRRYRASTDLCGLRSFYAVWLLAYASQCASCVSWCLWCDTELAWHSTRAPMLVCCGLTTVVGLAIAGGCVACALAVAAPGSAACDGSGPPACDTLVMHAEGLFYLCWGWAWAIVATRVYLLLRDRQRDAPRSDAAVVHFFFFDLNVRRATRFRLLHVANVLAPAALCTYGPFLIIYVFVYSTSRGLDTTEVYSRNRVGLIYHCGVLSCHTLTYYLALNVPSQQSYAAARGKRLR